MACYNVAYILDGLMACYNVAYILDGLMDCYNVAYILGGYQHVIALPTSWLCCCSSICVLDALL